VAHTAVITLDVDGAFLAYGVQAAWTGLVGLQMLRPAPSRILKRLLMLQSQAFNTTQSKAVCGKRKLPSLLKAWEFAHVVSLIFAWTSNGNADILPQSQNP
jgi:hypothetical protein